MANKLSDNIKLYFTPEFKRNLRLLVKKYPHIKPIHFDEINKKDMRVKAAFFILSVLYH